MAVGEANATVGAAVVDYRFCLGIADSFWHALSLTNAVVVRDPEVCVLHISPLVLVAQIPLAETHR